MTVFFGALSVLLALLNRGAYLSSILGNRTKPHLFSWITWSIISTIALAAQWSEGAGAGAWARTASTLFSYAFIFFALTRGTKHYTQGDWITFCVTLTAIPLWYLTETPVWSVLLVTTIDVVGYYPTIRKSIERPFEESAKAWILSGLSSLASLFAMENINIATCLYPFVMVVTNCGFGLFLFWQRQRHPESKI